MNVGDVHRAEPPAVVLSDKSPDVKCTQLPHKLKGGYDGAVLSAVKKMGLSLGHFELWVDEHPGSVLSHLKHMPPAMQANVASTALFIRSANPGVDAKTSWREAAALVHCSEKYDINPDLATAMAHVESTFNPDAVSSKGASGVMQVMWGLHSDLLRSKGIEADDNAENPLYDPEKAIEAGCLLMSRYIKASDGSVQRALERYYGARSSVYRDKVNSNIVRIMIYRASLNQQ